MKFRKGDIVTIKGKAFDSRSAYYFTIEGTIWKFITYIDTPTHLPSHSVFVGLLPTDKTEASFDSLGCLPLYKELMSRLKMIPEDEVGQVTLNVDIERIELLNEDNIDFLHYLELEL